MMSKLLRVFVLSMMFAGISMSETQIFAQDWEPVFQGSNQNNSAGEFYVEGDTILVGRKGGGLMVSEDGGATWNEEIIKPLDSDSKLGKFFKFKGNYYLHRLDYNPDNFVRSTEDFTTWEVMDGLPKRADGTTNGLTHVTTNGDIIFMKSWDYLDEDNNDIGDFLASEDGDEWIRTGNSINYGDFTFLGDDLYASSGNILLMSADTGKTWTEKGTLVDSLQIVEIHAGSTTLYAEARNRSNNNNPRFAMKWDMDENEWKPILKIVIEEGKFGNLQMHVDGDRIGGAVAFQGAFYSPDGGETWLSVGFESFNAVTPYLDGDYFYGTGPGSGFGEDLRRLPLASFQEAEFTSSEEITDLPNSLILQPNYPNPFNPATTIAFSTNQSGHTSLRIFDITGREIAVLVDGHKPAGTYNVSADLSGFSSGMYFYQLKLNGQTKTRKMTLLK